MFFVEIFLSMMFEFELLMVENFAAPKFVARSLMCAVDLFKKCVPVIVDCTTSTLLALKILGEFESNSCSFTLSIA